MTQIFRAIEAIAPGSFPEGSAVAVGKFDGVHRGHEAILTRVHDAAPLKSVALTFANHPLSYLKPELRPQTISSPQQRIERFEQLGIDACVMLDFDEKLASISAEDFVRDLLVGRLNAKLVVLGADFRFGHNGAGDAELLKRMGTELGFAVEVVEWVTNEGEDHVSSSRIREALLSGDVIAGERMLGRPPVVRGEVVHGDARGRELGMPTANLGGLIEGLIPADGVYAGLATVRGERHVAAISVGVNLTFEPDGEPRVEAFLLDFSGDLYGESIEVEFKQRLRGMVRFESIDSLIAQMQQDVRETRSLSESW